MELKDKFLRELKDKLGGDIDGLAEILVDIADTHHHKTIKTFTVEQLVSNDFYEDMESYHPAEVSRLIAKELKIKLLDTITSEYFNIEVIDRDMIDKKIQQSMLRQDYTEYNKLLDLKNQLDFSNNIKINGSMTVISKK